MSKNFQRKELACKHCGQEVHSPELIAVLELVRLKFKSPVIITSGYRCLEHNDNVGGAPNSKHIYGIAADIKVKGVSPIKVFEFIDDTFPETYGIGLYSSWVHIDTRTGKARW
jgi:uncharacterized protein YcbK (DUF882 family)